MLATAFGLNSVFFNLGMFVSPLIVGQTLKTTNLDGYLWTMIYFSCLSIVCILINIVLYWDDKTRRGGLLSKADV